MSFIHEEIRSANPSISFEFFPPRTEEGISQLKDKLNHFHAQKPQFIDFTWAAGGSSSDSTMDLSKFAHDLGFNVNMHLTCTNMPYELIDIALQAAQEYGIKNICALRGDPPKGQDAWEAVDGGFSCALDLVNYIQRNYEGKFNLSVAGYPEGHPNSITVVDDVTTLSDSESARLIKLEDGSLFVCRDEDYVKEIEYLKKKIDAGASVIITQLFYDVDLFLKFVEECKKAGIDAPVLPGIMPVRNAAGFKKMTGFCKTRIPEELSKLIELEDESELQEKAMEYVVNICRKLLDNEIKGLHFYTLNNEELTFKVLGELNLLK